MGDPYLRARVVLAWADAIGRPDGLRDLLTLLCPTCLEAPYLNCPCGSNDVRAVVADCLRRLQSECEEVT
jgi:hypothetical protein